jgi:MFS family permease
VKKNPLVTVVVWLAVQIVNVAVWIVVRMLVRDLELSPGIAALVATGVTLPAIALVNLIVYYWVSTEYGGVVMSGLLGGLLIALVAGAAETVTSAFAVSMTQEHGLDFSILSALILVKSVLLFVGPPLAGLLADRVGKRIVLAGGVLLTAAATVALGMAENVVLIGLALAGIGLGFAMLVPTLLVSLFETVWSRRLYATVAGFYLGTATLGQVVGLVIAPLAVYRWFDGQFSGAFTATGLIALACGVVGLGGLGLSSLLERGRPRPESQLATPPVRLGIWHLVLVGLLVLCAGGAIAVQPSLAMLDDRWPEPENTLLNTFAAGSMLAMMLAQFLGGPLADLCNWLAMRNTHRSWGRTMILLLGALTMCGGALV